MRVIYEGKAYTFDPNKQKKDNFLDYLVTYIPMPLRWKIWLTEQAIRRKGIIVEVVAKEKEVSDALSKEDLGRH
jgi:hypothetical protein